MEEGKTAEDWFDEGNKYYLEGDFTKAIGCFDKAIELNPDDPDAYNNKGSALDRLGEYPQAIECYDKAIELNPDDPDAYNNKGSALDRLGEYRQAIECFDKAIVLNRNDPYAYFFKGYALNKLGEYAKEIECYDRAIELTPEDPDLYSAKGNALDDLGKYRQAIECFDKVIELAPDDLPAYNFKGMTLDNLGEYRQAIECYNKAIELNPDDPYAYDFKGCSLYHLGYEHEATKSWDKEVKRDKSLSGWNQLLYDSIYFDETIGDAKGTSAEDKYRDIYITSLKIQQLLQVKEHDECEDCETQVAHYTKRDVVDALFFGKKEKDKDGNEITTENHFRLNSITNSNDKQEGKTLFQYLFDGRKIKPQAEPYVAFVGCFMFNFDNLNQFRLYGKDGKKEGTGVSIVVKRDYFCLINRSSVHIEGRRSNPRDGKAPLFRCIYIDPDTNQVVSVGHRDYHTFYKTKEIMYNYPDKEKRIRKIRIEVRKYKRFVDEKIKVVTKGLEELKDTIDKNKAILDMGTVCNLLLNLRYLVKHVAFKEEQECRVVKIKSLSQTLDKDKPKDDNLRRFYLEYLPLKNNVSRVYFGPKAEGMEVFQNMLAYREEFKEVVCYRSTSPLA